MAKAEESPKKKKGVWRWLVFAGLGVVVLVAVMALFNICPPDGPWPTPPWCSAGSGKYGGFFSVVLKGKCPPPGPWPRPPWCEDPALKAKKGESTHAIFWVTVPYNTPVNRVSLAINGREPVAMEHVGELSYQTTAEVVGGEELTYSYVLDGEVTPTTYQTKIDKKDQHIYDAVYGNLVVKPALGIYMQDTWGRNYNFTWMEDTHNHVESAMARVAATGVKEVIVTDNHRAEWRSGRFTLDNLDYSIVGEIFINDQRDEEMDQEDFNRLVAAAHAQGLEIAWSTNFTFVNFGEYIGNNVAEMDRKDFELVNGEKSEAWVRDFMGKWKAFLLDQAVSVEKAGFDTMFIHPGYHDPNLQPYLDIADDIWLETIKELRTVFSGKLANMHGSFPNIGDDVKAWRQLHEHYYQLDQLYLGVDNFANPWSEEFKPKGTSFADIKASYQKYFEKAILGARETGINPSITLMVESSEDFLNQGFVQSRVPHEKANQLIKRDWQYQADCYEAFLQVISKQDFITSVVFSGYGWDDAMDPENSIWPISLSATPRNKPAEAVIKKWAIPLK